MQNVSCWSHWTAGIFTLLLWWSRKCGTCYNQGLTLFDCVLFFRLLSVVGLSSLGFPGFEKMDWYRKVNNTCRMFNLTLSSGKQNPIYGPGKNITNEKFSRYAKSLTSIFRDTVAFESSGCPFATGVGIIK